MDGLERNEAELVKLLRDEASQVKNCFTQYSFQALAFSTVALGVIINYQREHPPIALASILIIVLVLAVGRIGVHKYATANRNYGYQLHLERTARINAPVAGGWSHAMRRLGWEESMRAWRVVQATAFEALYTTGRWRPNVLRPEHQHRRDRWFEPRSLLVEGAAWHSGTYLGNMLTVLNFVAGFALIPLMILAYQSWHLGWAEFAGSVLVLLATTLGAAIRIQRTDARRIILEEGLLSIHSCAVMWQGVAMAHHKALRELGANSDGKLLSYSGYTKSLSRQATEMSSRICEIHSWIEEGL